MSKGRKRIIYVTAGLILALLLFLFLGLCAGSVSISPAELWKSLFGSGGNEVKQQIILELRFPRCLMAIILGGALALSGLLLQSFFENPIAGPFVLGISSGAKLFVAALLIISLKAGFTLSSLGMILAAFLGALLTVGLLMVVARRLSGGASMLVAGIMIGYVCSAVTDLVINISDDQNVVSLHNWSMGSFSGTQWSHVIIAAAIVLPLLILAIFLAKPMQAYYLGEAVAESLGVNLKLFRVLLVVTASLLAATVTAFAGPISFVGIAVPFLIRRLAGTERTRVIIPLSFLGGAVFCLLADLLSRLLLAPTELNVSVVTSLLGAPVVIVMLLIRHRREAAK